MQKREKEITDRSEINKILKTGVICRVAFFDDPFPYLLSFNYGYHDNCIYIHSALKGKKIDLINKNPRIAFEVTTDVEIVEAAKACGWSTKYNSVCGTGIAELQTRQSAKKRGLDIIMEQHGSRTVGDYNLKSIAEMLIIKIEIEQVTGKKS